MLITFDPDERASIEREISAKELEVEKEAEIKKQKEIEAENVIKQNNINAKIAKNKELIEAEKYYEAYKNGNMDYKGNIINETTSKGKKISNSTEKMYQKLFDEAEAKEKDVEKLFH